MAVVVKKKAPPKIAPPIKKPVVADIHKTQPDGSEEDSQEVVGEIEIAAGVQTAEVEFSCGLTRNLGDYQSIKFHVTLRIPCAVDPAEIEETYTQAKTWVDTKVNEMNAEVDEMVNG